MIYDICGRTEFECKISKIKGMYLCPKHKTQYYRYGVLNNDRTIYTPNEYIFEDDLCKITLYDKHNNVVGYGIIDADDYEKVKPYKWYMKKNKNVNYVVTKVNGKLIFLHRLLLNITDKCIIDHINNDGLDNRMSNLRLSNKSLNGLNGKNKYSGIIKVKSGKYQLNLTVNYECLIPLKMRLLLNKNI